jgi:sRNA-binding carbon storage regulator CsrA
MALVLQLHQHEKLTIGDVVIQCEYVQSNGRIKIWIEAPKSVGITREYAIKKMVHG